MTNSYKFFANKDCQYYPCHTSIEEINCLFCYCPLYPMEHCPGKPQYLETTRGRIKDCSACTFPHEAENYDIIMQCLCSENKKHT